ncbi:MAG: SAVED domain-containing protein [Caldimicrobium sp.]|jgi:hypothetical protein|nr:SAVED domain-containing protein [Caldimicrobium sp.]
MLRFLFEDFDENHILSFLEQGLLDEHIEELLMRWNLFSPKVQFALINYIRERLKDSFSPRVLVKHLKIKPIKDADQIVRGKGKHFEIIVVDKDKADFAKGLVIPNTSKVITNLPELKNSSTIVKKLLNKNFAVFFDTYISGKSFMLPLAVALNIERIPEDLRFTGALNAKGDILEVEHLKEKIEFAKAQGLRLITPLQVKRFNTIKAYLEKDKWDIPFYITSAGYEEFSNFLKAFIGEKTFEEFEVLKGLELFYGLQEDTFYQLTGQLKTEEDWKKVCQDFYTRYYKIVNTLPWNKIFHLGMRGAVALSFAFGVLYSHFYPFVFYHYQAKEGETKYHTIPIYEPRYLKERKSQYNHINTHFEHNGEDLVILLNFGHHEAIADVKSYAFSHLNNPSFLVLEAKQKGNVPIESFSEVAKECASAIQDIRSQYSTKTYHFFFSCPIPIAFMVGLAFGHYVDGWIYNFQKDGSSYQPVLEFRFLRKIREGNVRN